MTKNKFFVLLIFFVIILFSLFGCQNKVYYWNFKYDYHDVKEIKSSLSFLETVIKQCYFI